MTDSLIQNTEIARLDQRSRDIFRLIVESYLGKGEPVSSRNLSRQLPIALSPASVRNVMADLEELGLIYAPHTSAGRLPTHTGLRLFVDGLLELGDLSEEERAQIEAKVGAVRDQPIEDVLSEAGELISGLSHCAGVVLSQKQIERLKQIEFVALDPGKALVVLVGEDSGVENRIISIPEGLPPSALVEATNYLNAILHGLTLQDVMAQVAHDIKHKKAELDVLTTKVIEAGLASWSGVVGDRKSLIVRGRANLLNELTAAEDLERVRQLFDDLETKESLIELLGATETADGVSIFIGSESKLFSLSGSSLIVAPFKNGDRKIVGALGVIGPTRLNYARIIPMVDYTARLVGRLLA